MDVIAEHYLYHVLTTFHPARRKANILVVIDVSGSMNVTLAPNSDSPLISLARNGIGQLASGLMPSTSHIGLWEFGSQAAATSTTDLWCRRVS